MFCLIDCDNFFVSCERLFNPSLERKPVIVLSNNDGCAISRSNEAKALGIQMGEPLFKIDNLVRQHNVQVFSSNFALYGDISRRIMSILQTFTPLLEVYSIDEAFLDLSGFSLDLSLYGQHIHQIIYQWVGIPVSIGIGSTKTLAKVASKIAKKHPSKVCLLKTQPDIDEALINLAVQDIWGIGRQHGKSLREQAIYTAYEFMNLDPGWVRKKYTVMGERILRELNGISCLPIEAITNPKKSIQVSRSFAHNIKTLEGIQQAVATHLSSLGGKLRRDKLFTGYVSLYIRNSTYETNYTFLTDFKVIDPATNDTHTLLKLVLPLATLIFKEGINYKKAGVMAGNLSQNLSRQLKLLPFEADIPKHSPLLNEAIDELNQRFGKATIRYAVCGVHSTLKIKSEKKSPNYTGNWAQLKVVS
jgi:DNA polymerase V